jgi:hypothetical protein
MEQNPELMNDLQDYLEGDTETAFAATQRIENRAKFIKALGTTMADSDFLLERQRFWTRAMINAKEMSMEQNTPLPNTIPGDYPGLRSWVEPEPNDPNDYIAGVKDLVRVYIESQLRRGIDTLPAYSVYVVWFAKTLQNWKALVCTTMVDEMYYEVTYNGDKRETYIDAYRKQSNTVIPD